jgi:replication factor A1
MMIVVDLDLVEKFASPINPDLAAPSVPMQQVSSSSSGAAGGGSSSSSSSSNNNNNMANSSASSVYGQSSYGHAAAAVTKPVMRAEAQIGVIPIRGLTPYNHRWAIKARVTNKGEKKTWNNAKGTGTLFSIDLLDSDGGEIRGTFFKDTCEKFFPIIEQQKVYTFSGGSLKPANRKYSNIDNGYEITFDDKTTISPVEDDATIDNIKFDFIKIRDTESDEMVGKTVDVIGFVKSAGECAKITSKNQAGKEFEKRDLVVIDDSGAEIKVTLWGEKAKEEPGWDLAPVCAFKSLKVSEYGGRSLSMNSNGFFQVNPTIPEGYALFAWFQGQGTDKIQNVSSTSMSTGGRSEGGALDPLEKRKYIGSIKADLMGRGDKPEYCTIKGQVTFLRHDTQPWYDACTVGDCKKKVIAVMGRYKCDKCNIDMDDVNRRYVMSAQISDHTGQNWFSFFDAEGTKLLGMSAQELHLLKETEGEGGASLLSLLSTSLILFFLRQAQPPPLPLHVFLVLIHPPPPTPTNTSLQRRLHGGPV